MAVVLLAFVSDLIEAGLVRFVMDDRKTTGSDHSNGREKITIFRFDVLDGDDPGPTFRLRWHKRKRTTY